MAPAAPAARPRRARGHDVDVDLHLDRDVDLLVDLDLDVIVLVVFLVVVVLRHRRRRPCAMGCDAGFVDADGDPATGTCGCEFACSMGCPQGFIDADKSATTGLCGCEYSCAMGCAPGSYDIDGNPLTGACGCEYACVPTGATDPIDEAFHDDNCDGTDGVAEKCVYVSASQGNDGTGAGTRTSPVQTIAKALEVAQLNGVPSVCLSGEIYNEKVNVVSGINIYGGFDQNNADFKFKRTGVTTTVAAVGTVFDAAKIDVETHIEGLTIEAAAMAAVSGSSTYGVRLGTGVGQLFVRYNVINVQQGADGAAGVAGAAPAQAIATSGANGGNGCSNGNCALNGAPGNNCAQFGGKGGDGGYSNQAGFAGAVGSRNTPAGAGGAQAPSCGTNQSKAGGNGTAGQAGIKAHRAPAARPWVSCPVGSTRPQAAASAPRG